jgi:integral membrane protein (TIGR01906 family)
VTAPIGAAPATSPATVERRRPLLTATAAIAAAIVILAIAHLPFQTPRGLFAGQDRAEADAWTGWPIETVHAVTGSVLSDLIIGPPEFDQTVDGAPVFDEAERGHLRDVRTVLIGFTALAVVGTVALIAALGMGRGDTQAWRGVGLGARILAIGIVAIGIFSVVAFDTAFELFHRLLFPAGSYTFDPATERLVQLFPEAFWYQTAIAIGLVIIVLAALAMALAWWRIRIVRGDRRAAAAEEPSPASSEPVSDDRNGGTDGAAPTPAR